MTPFDKWVQDTAAAMVKPTEDEWSDLPEYEAPNWDALRLRFAIALVQARALECRQISASIIVKRVETPAMLAAGLTERSHNLEELGMKMAKGEWPPKDEVPGPRLVQ